MQTLKIANKDALKLDLISRSGYRFDKLSKEVVKVESDEPLVSSDTIIKSGLIVEPFWNMSDDFEGDLYRDYMNLNPEFTLSVRSTVLEKLKNAQTMLPRNWRLVLKAGYRPYTVQIALFNKLVEDAMSRQPDWSHKECIAYARTFVSDPSDICPPHTTGGAVDLDVVDTDTSGSVDMGCPPNTNSEVAYLFSPKLSKVQQENRLTLLKAMLGVGFAPLAAEWWHFQYGETIWAAFYGQSETKYDIIVDKIKSK